MRSTPSTAAPTPATARSTPRGPSASGTFTLDPGGIQALARRAPAGRPSGCHRPLLERERRPLDLRRPRARRPRHGGQVPPPRWRGHRHRLRAAGRLLRAHARGLPGVHAGPDPRPGDRAARSGEAERLPRRASGDRRRAPEGHGQARPDHQLRHLGLPRAPRVRPGRRRRREALGPLHLGAGGGDRVPDRRAARRGRPRLPPGRDPGAAEDRHRTVHARVHPRQSRATPSTTRPRNGRASTRWSSSASSR